MSHPPHGHARAMASARGAPGQHANRLDPQLPGNIAQFGQARTKVVPDQNVVNLFSSQGTREFGNAAGYEQRLCCPAEPQRFGFEQ